MTLADGINCRLWVELFVVRCCLLALLLLLPSLLLFNFSIFFFLFCFSFFCLPFCSAYRYIFDCTMKRIYTIYFERAHTSNAIKLLLRTYIPNDWRRRRRQQCVPCATLLWMVYNKYEAYEIFFWACGDLLLLLLDTEMNSSTRVATTQGDLFLYLRATTNERQWRLVKCRFVVLCLFYRHNALLHSIKQCPSFHSSREIFILFCQFFFAWFSIL